MRYSLTWLSGASVAVAIGVIAGLQPGVPKPSQSALDADSQPSATASDQTAKPQSPKSPSAPMPAPHRHHASEARHAVAQDKAHTESTHPNSQAVPRGGLSAAVDSPSAASPGTPHRITDCNGVVVHANFRSQPNLHPAFVQAVMSPGETLYLTGVTRWAQGELWYEAIARGKEGWIARCFIE